jgi:type IV secretory pathway component VirB8
VVTGAELARDNRQRAWRVVTAVTTILGVAGLCVIVTVPLAKLLITGFQKTSH